MKYSQRSIQTTHASPFAEEQSYVSYKQGLIKWELQRRNKYIWLCILIETYVSNVTVNCPLGTYYSLEHHACESCWTGSYQDEEGQLECKSCPSGSYTEYLHSRSISECKGENFIFFRQPPLTASAIPLVLITGMRLTCEMRISPNCPFMHICKEKRPHFYHFCSIQNVQADILSLRRTV